MAGQTDNDIILDAANQLIVAVNDLLTTHAAEIGLLIASMNTNNAALVQELEQLRDACGGGCCCCGVGNGVVSEGAGITMADACDFPDGFEDFNAYKTYKCNAANLLADDLIATMEGLESYWTWFISKIGPSRSPYPNPIEIYDTITLFLPNLLPNSIEYNLTPAILSEIKQEMTDRFVNWLELEVLNDWSNGTLDRNKAFWVYRYMHQYFSDNKQTIVDDIFNNSTSAADAKSRLSGHLSDAKDYALTQNPDLFTTDEALATMTKMLTSGFINILFMQSSFAMNYIGDVICTGNAGCCPPYTLLAGSEGAGNNEYVSENTGGQYEIDIIYNATAIGDVCGDEQQSIAPTILTGSITLYETYGPDNSQYYSDSSPWFGSSCAQRFRFVSNESFSIDFNPGDCS